MTDYTKEAQRLADEYARQFHGPTYSLDDNNANFDLRDASILINEARREKEEYLKSKTNKDVLAQQRSAVGLLPDRDAERFLKELNKPQEDYVADAKIQAEHYADARRRGASPKSFDADDAQERSIREDVISWLERQRARGHFPRKK